MCLGGVHTQGWPGIVQLEKTQCNGSAGGQPHIRANSYFRIGRTHLCQKVTVSVEWLLSDDIQLTTGWRLVLIG